MSALFKSGEYRDRGVQHSLHIWHGAKNLGKNTVALDVRSSVLRSSVGAEISPTMFGVAARKRQHMKHSWVCGLDVTDEHQWCFGSCRPGPSDETGRTREWILKGSAAQHRLQQTVLDACW